MFIHSPTGGDKKGPQRHRSRSGPGGGSQPTAPTEYAEGEHREAGRISLSTSKSTATFDLIPLIHPATPHPTPSSPHLHLFSLFHFLPESFPSGSVRGCLSPVASSIPPLFFFYLALAAFPSGVCPVPRHSCRSLLLSPISGFPPPPFFFFLYFSFYKLC